MMKLCYLDCETTGLEPADGAVICSIAFILEDNGERVATKEFVFTPSEEEWAQASPEALKVNGLTWEYLTKEGMPRDEQAFWMRKWLQKHGIQDYTLVGQNIKFDLKFLLHFFADQLMWVGFPFENSENVMDLAKKLRARDRTFKPTRLSGHEISKALGVEEEDVVHTAIGGAEVVMRNYKELVRRLSNKTSARVA